jgi:hypothetical protein
MTARSARTVRCPRIERVQGRSTTGEAVPHVIECIRCPLGLRADGSSPYAHARLLDGTAADQISQNPFLVTAGSVGLHS